MKRKEQKEIKRANRLADGSGGGGGGGYVWHYRAISGGGIEAACTGEGIHADQHVHVADAVAWRPQGPVRSLRDASADAQGWLRSDSLVPP